MYFSSFEMTKNRTPTPVYLDHGMHPGLEVKGLNFLPLQVTHNFKWLKITHICVICAQIFANLDV